MIYSIYTFWINLNVLQTTVFKNWEKRSVKGQHEIKKMCLYNKKYLYNTYSQTYCWNHEMKINPIYYINVFRIVNNFTVILLWTIH